MTDWYDEYEQPEYDGNAIVQAAADAAHQAATAASNSALASFIHFENQSRNAQSNAELAERVDEEMHKRYADFDQVRDEVYGLMAENSGLIGNGWTEKSLIQTIDDVTHVVARRRNQATEAAQKADHERRWNEIKAAGDRTFAGLMSGRYEGE